MKKRFLSAVLCCAMLAGSFAVPTTSFMSVADNTLSVSAASYGGVYYVNQSFTASFYFYSGQMSKTFKAGSKISITSDGYYFYYGSNGRYTKINMKPYMGKMTRIYH